MKITNMLLTILRFVFVKKRKENIMVDFGKFEKSSFAFLGGRNNNEFYIFPKNENQFKKESFETKEMWVHIIHPDGYIEDFPRKVGVIWGSSILFNLETMQSKRTKLKLSDTKNLVVYAYPQKYKELITKNFFD